MKKSVIRELKGGPMNGSKTEVYTSYLDFEGKKVEVLKGDKLRRSGQVGLYYLRPGGYYEWNNR